MSDSGGGSVSRRSFLTLAGTSGALALAGCTEDRVSAQLEEDDLSGQINITGSTTIFPLMAAFAEEFSKDYPDINIDISATGTGGGFSELFCQGNSHFNNASRPIKPAEEAICAENGIGYIQLVAAIDALTVVVNEANDWVDCLTVEQLARIWEEDPVETWQELDETFPDERIVRYGADDTTGTFDYFIQNVQGEERGHTDDYQATEKDNTIVQGVRGNEYAIGYFGFSYFYQNPEQVVALAIDGGGGCVRPTLESAATGEYRPLSRPLFTYLSKPALREAHVVEFARYFLERTTSQELVAERVGYVPNTEEMKREQLELLERAIEEGQ